MDEQTRAALEHWFGCVEQEFQRVHADNAKLHERLGALERNQESLQRSHESLQRSHESLQERLGALERSHESLHAQLATLRRDMNERFESVADQIRTLTLRTDQFETRVESSLATLAGEFTSLRELARLHMLRMKRIETGLLDLNRRVDTLADDMRQRFRVVNERLTAAA